MNWEPKGCSSFLFDIMGGTCGTSDAYTFSLQSSAGIMSYIPGEEPAIATSLGMTWDLIHTY